MEEDKMSLSDKLATLNRELKEAIDAGDDEKARGICCRIAGLIESDNIELDMGDPFVRKWYDDGW